jgi:hypothetical protein
MVKEQEQDSGRRPANQGVRDVIPEPNKIGCAREFGERAKWRRLERFALPGMAGLRIPALNGRSEADTSCEQRSL